MEILDNYIPESSPIFSSLMTVAEEAKIVVFSGLPGVGKSLYMREFRLMARSLSRPVDVIQWDVARKAFETEYVLAHYPMGEGTVHNGLKLMAGQWLKDELVLWSEEHAEDDRILLIEAPLVGHRFVELAMQSDSSQLESRLSDHTTQIIVPIPSSSVRAEIEAERARQVREDAKVWSGAKPSVMLMLWKMTCEIGNELGLNVDMDGQPPYDPEVYKFVFGQILKHRNFIPLMIDQLYEVPTQNESALHDDQSMQPTSDVADHYGQMIKENYTDLQIDEIVNRWYLT